MKKRSCLDHLPPELQTQVSHYWQDFTAASQRIMASPPPSLSTSHQQAISTLWALSDYAAKLCIHNPSLLFELLASGDLHKTYRGQAYHQRLTKRVATCQDPSSLFSPLRQFRHREMLRIIWRDLVLGAPLKTTMRDLTRLAESCVSITCNKLHTMLQQRYGTPSDPNGMPLQLLILALGKLGAEELNLSSDIDLILVYPKSGQTNGARRIDNEISGMSIKTCFPWDKNEVMLCK